MTTREFIGQVVAGNIRKAKTVSSVFYNGVDCIYSYGYHYPLLLNIAGRWILNDRGYSNTTRRHIYWASQYADYRASFGRINNYGIGNGHDNAIQALKAGIESELESILEQKKTLSQRAWRQRANLNDRLDVLFTTREFIRGLK